MPKDFTDVLAMVDAADELLNTVDELIHEGRLAFSLALESCLGAKLDVIALGPYGVAFIVHGAQGLPSPSAVARIREAALERGLRVAAVTIA